MHSNEDQSFNLSSRCSDEEEFNYNFITFESRLKFIQMVCVSRITILKAAEKLGIKLSTAKYILQCWKKKGKILYKFDGKKMDQLKINEQIEELKAKILEISVSRAARGSKKSNRKVSSTKRQLKTQDQAIIKKQCKIQENPVVSIQTKIDQAAKVEELPKVEQFQNAGMQEPFCCFDPLFPWCVPLFYPL